MLGCGERYDVTHTMSRGPLTCFSAFQIGADWSYTVRWPGVEHRAGVARPRRRRGRRGGGARAACGRAEIMRARRVIEPPLAGLAARVAHQADLDRIAACLDAG